MKNQNDDLQTTWELFQLNNGLSSLQSKSDCTEAGVFLPQEEIVPLYSNYPAIKLDIQECTMPPLNEVIRKRHSTQKMRKADLTIHTISQLLYYSYALVDRKFSMTQREVQLRSTPSAGGLYPIDLYLHYSGDKKALAPGLYYYDVAALELRHLIAKDCIRSIQEAFLQSKLIHSSSIQLFYVANLKNMIGKYGDRGYKFALLEAGHIAQNINLVATALDLGVINCGGYYDDKLNEFLELDGLWRSIVYTTIIGKSL